MSTVTKKEISPSTSTSSNSTNKNLFQIDFSFIGHNKFESRKELNSEVNQESPRSNFIKTSVYCIRLSRLLKAENKSARDIIKQKFKLKRTCDLIHTICALYDNALPDIGAQSVYDCVCSPKSFTICVLKEDVEEEKVDDKNIESSSQYGSQDDLKTIEGMNEYPESIFSNLFSDEEEEEESDSEDHKVDYTRGLKTFLEKCRDKENPKVPLLSNLIAVATIQKTSTFQLPGKFDFTLF